MNDLPCSMIRDLLPLYHDGVCSPESAAAVLAHLSACPTCRAELSGMDAALADPRPTEGEPLRAMGLAWRSARRKSFCKGLGIAGGLLLCTALLVGVFFCFFTADRMVGPSMEPTLPDGSLCLFLRNAKPDRDSIVNAQTDWLAEYGIKDFIRVVGLPGDTISIEDGTVYVNGKPSERFPAGEIAPGDRVYPLTLGTDEYFVMGDNHTNSLDSRFERYGLLSGEDILGVLILG